MKKKTKTPQQKRSALKKKADKLMSLFIRKVGRCERCGKEQNLQCAHVITRSNLRLRYDESNLLCLCSGCHLWWHKEMLEAVMWFNHTYPERSKYLMVEKNKIEKPDYEAIIKRLTNFI